MIVVEGIDNSGKSTLIKTLNHMLHWSVQTSEGPPKYPGEMDIRVNRYLTDHPQNMIYDRHPCVSQPIYGMMRTHKDPINPVLIRRFYQRIPFFIYCDGGARQMQGHLFNPDVDSAEHLEAVGENYLNLLTQYRHWAAQHAHVNYRIGDDINIVMKIIEKLFG